MHEENKAVIEKVKAAIANPRIKVMQTQETRGHWYEAFNTKTGEPIGTYPSVTAALDIIGGGKTHGLMNWAKNESLKRMKEVLLENKIITTELTEAYLDNIIILAKRKPKEILRQAADWGTKAHNRIDAYINGIEPDVLTEFEAEVEIAYKNFMDMVFEEDLDFICGDIPVLSPPRTVQGIKLPGFGGRIDALAARRGKLVLVDFKTSNAIRDDAALQVGGGYNQALFKTLGVRASEAMVCRFDKTDPNQFETKMVNLKNAEKAWIHALLLNASFKPKLLWRKQHDTQDRKNTNKTVKGGTGEPETKCP